MKWLFFLSIMAAGQGLFQSVLLFKAIQKRNFGKLWLALLLLLLSIMAIEYAATLSEDITHFIHLVGFTFITQFLLLPLTHFYFRAQQNHKLNFKSWDVLHFLPFVVLLLYELSFLSLAATAKMEFYEQALVTRDFYASSLFLTVSSLFVLQLGVYFFLWRKTDFRQLINSVIYLLVFHALFNMTLALRSSLSIVFCTSLTALFIFLIYYVSYRNTFPKKYKASTLSQPKANQLVLQLQKLLEKEALYLNEDLKISDLAAQLKVSVQHLSQMINQELNTNFRGLINQYRIQYAMQLMTTKKGKWNLKEIAFQSGFNNKTTFATAFKKVNGSTPSQYLEELKMT